ncbi:MAG: hypothetical protein OXF32_03535 [Anaerolineaceae bacterium]|nr:hypothetical protein [Anaerolineaceae bacterium]
MLKEGSPPGGAIRRLWVPACFCLLAFIVFATQFAGTGFGVKGQHYAWVSSQNLAIFSRATPENGFVGHTRSLLDADGAPDHLYFDRYPPFFSALLAALIHLTEDLATKVWIARQTMHVIFILTMLFAWLLLRRLGLAPGAALVGVIMAFSGHMLLFYREMIDTDHPALLVMLLLLYVIARVKLERRERWRWLTLATLLAVTVGRSFLSLGVLGLWAAMEAAGLLWQWEQPLALRLRAFLRHDATRMLLLAVAWLALMLGYSVTQEMARRQLPPEETGILHSMLSRLPGGEVLENWKADYDAFASKMERRLLRWFLPLDSGSGETVHQWALLPALLLILHYAGRQSAARRLVLLLTTFSGLAWLFVMINLTWFHDYTTMHALGFALVFWLALLDRVWPKRLINLLLLLALALFLRQALEVEAENRAWNEAAAIYTDDYNRILQEIGYSGSVVFSDPAFQDRTINIPKYLLSFYLGDNYLATRLDDADYMVADRAWLALPGAGGRDDLRLLYTVTPENQVGFLFDLRSGERYAPGDVARRFNFGNALTLGHWELLEGVEARPCQRIRVESWWRAQVPLPASYRLQLSLVGEDGGILASADGAPVGGNTQDWHPGRWYPDGRTLQVPCEAAGAWSLILSVYDPETDALNDKLPLVNADGSAGDTWLYLTTVSVN